MTSHLKIEVTDHIQTVTISRPSALNALNFEILDGLREMIMEVYKNSGIHGLIITGEGEKSFVAGADIKEIASVESGMGKSFSEKGQEIFQLIERCPKPVIAAVNGFALGGGCELAMACHLRLATQNAKFGLPEVTLGIIPGYGGTQRLPQLVGRGKALELMMTADIISAEEARSIGLVNRVVLTREELMSVCLTIMKKITANGRLAVSRVIDSVCGAYSGEDDGYAVETANFALCVSSEDFKEGTEAFIAKRKPSFKGI
ncbi:MAG: enoyl-CoA hydratase-related protein [Chryseolinea sp.]